ncbi:hypothetical protein SLEP1_g3648 [Rubroshorea leprosula]|uniref:Uncharacterized protein n=1 Tax=Rubroshorea leprosula TaxID=152421 RepID=A0AAV5HUX3_9ROSI|nr:hypothetical protein SLEP1_g3648 [Rubroshorea leprosula]
MVWFFVKWSIDGSKVGEDCSVNIQAIGFHNNKIGPREDSDVL